MNGKILLRNWAAWGRELSPAIALAVGLKVDADALPPAVVGALRPGKVDLTDSR
jgi:hypothetical protein